MKEITLHNGMVAIVDDQDYERVSAHHWSAKKSRKTWYAFRTVLTQPRTVFMHRVILDAPTGTQVDHRDGNGLNNRRENIRLATHGQNMTNRETRRVNTSGYKGVVLRNGRWLAQIKHNKRYYGLGLHDDPVAAAKAYDKKAIELHGQFAKLNFEEAT